mgnify:CR=1 FL=1
MLKLRIYEHLPKIKGLEVGADVVGVLEGSGFENLLKLTSYNGKHCHYLIQAFATKYSSDNQTFILDQNGNLKLYFGLRDILHITGLPISGMPLIIQEAQGEDIAREIFSNLEVYHKNRGFSLKTLKHIAINKTSENEFEHPLEIRVRATVLYLLGCLIFPDSSVTHVRSIYGAFLRDIKKISHYAWGEACLVEIHNSLKMFSLAKDSIETIGLGGSMLALMVGHLKFHSFLVSLLVWLRILADI